MKVQIEAENKNQDTWRLVLEVISAVLSFFKHRHNVPETAPDQLPLVAFPDNQTTMNKGVKVSIKMVPAAPGSEPKSK